MGDATGEAIILGLGILGGGAVSVDLLSGRALYHGDLLMVPSGPRGGRMSGILSTCRVGSPCAGARFTGGRGGGGGVG